MSPLDSSASVVSWPLVRHGIANANKKSEDRWVERAWNARTLGLPPVDDTTRTDDDSFQDNDYLRMFGIFDGHNGPLCADYLANNFPNVFEQCVKDCMSSSSAKSSRESSTDMRSRVIQTALTLAFLRTDETFSAKHAKSGSTATVVVIEGWRIFTANVGDSLASLDVGGNKVRQLAYNFRVEIAETEQARIRKAGQVVNRLLNRDGDPVGPLRVWPGGLCLSRAIGDVDVGPVILAKPHIGMVDLREEAGGAACERGCRIVLASDGHWETQGYTGTANKSRGLPAQEAADKLIATNLQTYGLHDDIALYVVDILPRERGLDYPATSNGTAAPRCGLPFFRGVSSKTRVTSVQRILEIVELPEYLLPDFERSSESHVSAGGVRKNEILEDSARSIERNETPPDLKKLKTFDVIAAGDDETSFSNDLKAKLNLVVSKGSPDVSFENNFVGPGPIDVDKFPSHEGTHHLGNEGGQHFGYLKKVKSRVDCDSPPNVVVCAL